MSSRGAAAVAWVEQKGVVGARRFWVEVATGAQGKFTRRRVSAYSQPESPITSPVVAVSATGDVYAAWVTDSVGPHQSRVWLAHRPRGGPWQPAVVVGRDGKWAGRPSLGVAADGRAVLAWEEDPLVYVGGHQVRRVRVLTTTAAGRLGPVQTLDDYVDHATAARPCGSTMPEPSVSVRGDGRAVVAWRTAGTAASCAVRMVAATSDAAGRFGAERVLSDEADQGGMSGPSTDINATGQAAVSWSQAPIGTTATHAQLAVAGRLGATWTAPVALSSDGTDFGAQVALADSGAAYVITTRDGPELTLKPSPGCFGAGELVLTRVQAGVAQSSVDLSAADTYGGDFPSLAIVGPTAALAVWGREDFTPVGRYSDCMTNDRGIGAALATPAAAPTLAPLSTRGARPVAASNRTGTGLVAWVAHRRIFVTRNNHVG